jgi:predicted dehydrogenase
MAPTTVVGIGAGGLATMELRLFDDLDGVEVAAAADVSADARDSFESSFDRPAYEDHATMIEEVSADAANVCTPHTLHHEHAAACLDAGMHVHVEKPMTTTTADARDLIRRADEHGCCLQVGYQRHFRPAYRELRRVATSGQIGEVHMAACHLAQNWIEGQRGEWRTNPDLSGGGQLIDSGSHLLDSLLWTTDADPRSVAAVRDTQGEAVDVNSALAATLDGPNREITASIGVTGDGTGFEEGLTLWGTEGHVTLRDEDIRIVLEGGPAYDVTVDSPDAEEIFGTKLAAFVDAVRGDREVEVTGQDGLRVTALTEAAFESMETGEQVAVDL